VTKARNPPASQKKITSSVNIGRCLPVEALYQGFQHFVSCLFLMVLFFCALSLDPEQKDQLIEVIEKLLADKTTVGFMLILLF